MSARYQRDVLRTAPRPGPARASPTPRPPRDLPRAPRAENGVPWLLRRVIQQQPVKSDICDRACECVEIHRLDDVTVGTTLVRLFDVRLFARGRQHHNRYASRAGIAFQATQHFETIDLGQLEVEQDDLGSGPLFFEKKSTASAPSRHKNT